MLCFRFSNIWEILKINCWFLCIFFSLKLKSLSVNNEQKWDNCGVPLCKETGSEFMDDQASCGQRPIPDRLCSLKRSPVNLGEIPFHVRFVIINFTKKLNTLPKIRLRVTLRVSVRLKIFEVKNFLRVTNFWKSWKFFGRFKKFWQFKLFKVKKFLRVKKF